MIRRTLPVGVLALVLVPAAAGTGAGAKVKKVSIHDNYYEPAKLTVKKGTTVKWVWPDDVGDTHDVNLSKRPRGVRRFSSELVATGYSFKRRLRKPGKYFIYCSLHDDMTMTIRVKR